MDKAFPILRAGTFTDLHGQTVTITPGDIDAIAASYQPGVAAASLVIGHPATNGPAMGAVARLEVQNGQLLAHASDLVPSFAELVRTKRYRRVSASLWPARHVSNPKPGAWYLRHVGFLGAQAPAVKGLGTVAFAEDDDFAIETVELAEPYPAFVAPPGYRAGGDLDLYARARAIQREKPGVPIWDAVQAVMRAQRLASHAQRSPA